MQKLAPSELHGVTVEQAIALIAAHVDTPVSGPLNLRGKDAARIPCSPYIWHVNAMPCTIRQDAIYAGFEILVGGEATSSGKPLVRPVPLGIWRCESTHPLFTLKDVPPSLLPLTIGMPSSYAELGELLVARYGALKGWTPDNVMNQPVALSLFTPYRGAGKTLELSF